MKHPHCNRSLFSHLFWCRGFAPVFFIVSVALIVVAIGSGIYFTSRPAVAPVVADRVVSDHAVFADATGTEVIAASADAVATTSKEASVSIASKPVRVKSVDCGSGDAAITCVFEHIAHCTAAKGTLIDGRTGVHVEHVIEGLKNGVCAYRSTVTVAPGQYAILEGLGVQCNLSTDQLLETLQSSEEDQLLRRCTGSYVDILRQIRGMDSATQ